MSYVLTAPVYLMPSSSPTRRPHRPSTKFSSADLRRPFRMFGNSACF